MYLQEVFEQLSHGELSQLSIGGGEMGEITQANYGRVLSHINLGLTALYKRFPLKEKRLVLQLVTDQFNYKIHSRFAVNAVGSVEPVRYLLDDASDPFLNDILKIEQVLTSEEYALGLNDSADLYSVFTPTPTTLRVPVDIVNGSMDLPDELKTTTLELVYRANHPKIVQDGYLDAETTEIELPDSHLEALLYYVASRVNNPIGMTNEFHAGNSYASKYENACLQLEMQNLRVDQDSQNSRLHTRGWV